MNDTAGTASFKRRSQLTVLARFAAKTPVRRPCTMYRIACWHHQPRALSQNAGRTRQADEREPNSTKTATTATGKYSRYALSNVMICAECGSRYKRVTWTSRGKKRVVWRCISRLDYGKRYCKTSLTVDENASTPLLFGQSTGSTRKTRPLIWHSCGQPLVKQSA